MYRTFSRTRRRNMNMNHVIHAVRIMGKYAAKIINLGAQIVLCRAVPCRPRAAECAAGVFQETTLSMRGRLVLVVLCTVCSGKL